MNVEWLVFDLGGVIVDYDPDAGWHEYARRFPECREAVRAVATDPDGPRGQLGSGQISATEYFAAIERAVGHSLSSTEHVAIDVGILRGERPQMVELLEELSGQVRLACFSNTHNLHWEHMLGAYRCMELFEVRVASHLIGACKPSPRAYEILCSRLGASPQQCAFVDDAPENVRAARDLGMEAIDYTSYEQLLLELDALGWSGGDGGTKEPLLRRATRALMLTPAGEVLLMMAQEPQTGREVWFTPGGGMDGDETPIECLRRELREETGLDTVEIGPIIWHRRHTFFWAGRALTQEETYYLVQVERFEPQMIDNPSPGEASAFREFRWWTADEIDASAALFAPRRLGQYVEQLIREGPPTEPFDTGV